MRELDVGVLRVHFFRDLSPQTRRVEHVRLVDAADSSAALAGDVERRLHDPPDLVLVVGQRVRRFPNAVLRLCVPHAEVQAAGQFTDDDEVEVPGLVAAFGERAGIRQFREQVCRSQVRVEPELLADLQEACFRPFFGRELVPGRRHRVAADRAHEDCVRRFCVGDRLLCQRFAVQVDGAAAHRDLGPRDLVAVLLANLLQYFGCFSYDLRSDAVSGDPADLHFHAVLPSLQPVPPA